jgi:Aspartyl protease/PDZ domain
LDGSGVTVPISFDAGKLVIEAKIDGKGPFPFLLDTGGHAILNPDAAKALDLVPTGGGVTHGSGSLSEQYTRVERVTVGSAEIKDQSFAVIPLQYTIVERGKEAPLAGILALEIFERFALSLDYHAKTLTLRPSQGFHCDGPGTKVLTRFSDDIPEIEAVADGAHGVFAIDSGNSGSLVIHAKFGNGSGLAEQLSRGLSLTSFGTGGESQNWINYLDRFEIAGTSLRHVLARYANDNKGAFSSRTEAGNIGSDILARFRIVFDYVGGALYFEADPSFQPTPYSRTGLQALKSDPEAFHVLTILPKTQTAEAGLMPGDVITAVDDISAADMSGSDLFYKMRQSPGTSLKLSVRRGNEVFSKTLVLRELLDRSNDYQATAGQNSERRRRKIAAFISDPLTHREERRERRTPIRQALLARR